MKRLSIALFYISALLLSPSLFAQLPTDILLSSGSRTVSAEEFERIYKKNYNLNAAEKQSVTDYFDMFLKFKLKVFAALDAGLDTLPSFKKELKGYRDQLAKNYLQDNQASDSLALEAYNHSLEDVNVSHILILFPDNPSPADTVACYAKIVDIQKKINAGQPFQELAQQYSNDPSAKANKGNLGYFSAFRFPYLFERCAYSIKPGQVSPILRTSYGYHLLKVNDRRPSPGEVKVAHIMCAVTNASDSAWNKAKTRIDNIYARLKQGEDFAQLARQASDDRSTAEQGGELPWFSTGRMVPEFENAAFAIKVKGDISQPTRTAHGWHMLKLMDKRAVPSFDQVKNEFKAKIMNDERAEIINASLVNKLKKQNPYKLYPANLAGFYMLDSAVYKGTININKASADKPLITIRETTLTGTDFKAYLTANPVQSAKVSVKEYIDASFTKFVNRSFVNYQDQHLERLYPDFGSLISEYHDGILLFDIMDKKVWSKATSDSTGLETFYNGMKNKPAWDTRLDATVLTCKTNQVATRVRKTMVDANSRKLTDSQIIKMVCDTADRQCLTIERKLFSRGERPTVDSLAWKPGLYELKSKNNDIMLIRVWGTRPTETKSLNEIRGLVTADYQNYLEEKWMADLKNKYNVVINQDLLHKIADKYKNN